MVSWVPNNLSWCWGFTGIPWKEKKTVQQNGFSVAVVGATGAVGNEMIATLEKRNFSVSQIKLLASERSDGKLLTFRGKGVRVEKLTKDSFKGVEIALFSAGAARSKEFATAAVQSGAVVIDNSSAFRMDPKVPLVVPEVNPHAVEKHQGLIANPNCSTIQMVVALKPLHDVVKIKRIVVSTYQSVSGTGKKAIDELEKQIRALLNFQEAPVKVYPYQIAFNCLPHIGSFTENGYSEEEMKMVNETHKIMEDYSIGISATTVRVPVIYSHSESVNVEFTQKLTAAAARDILSKAPGVVVVDDPKNNLYPLATNCAGKDETFVGRIREDNSVPFGLDMWIVADNIIKGAALNAVQIAELMIQKGLIRK